MKNKRNLKYLFLCLTITVLFTGCVSLMEMTGRALDRSAFEEKKISHYQIEKKAGEWINAEVTITENKAGDRSTVITLNDYPMMILRGTIPDEKGGFSLTSLEYLAGNVHGWNEFTLDLAGEGKLLIENVPLIGETALLILSRKIETVQISAGRIHQYDTRIVGNQALSALRNRYERIVSTVEWMADFNDAPNGMTIKQFEEYWKPRLFPELVSKKKRPSGWQKEGDETVKGEDINWNISYTQRILPEELWPIRNSGTLLRDWEEALAWIYLEYEWENIKEMLSRQILLREKK
ncbi:MAG: hypothetical protein FWC03_06655 [Treponema sp.]|nr:hypothetical protein [Treponema sp.]